MNYEKITLTTLRLSMGFIFLWAFLDKTFGLGFSTKSINAWIHGGSPTSGFLTHATQGPFSHFFNSLSGNGIIDWMFMLGLLFVGLTLITNYYSKWGSIVGILMLSLMYVALLWPANNPIIDEHIIYILVLSYFISKKNYR